MLDTAYSELKLNTFKDRYAFGDEQFPHQAWWRVAQAVGQAESTKELQDLWTSRFYEMQDNERYVPGGRITAAMGTGLDVTAQNCYVIPSPKDSREGIMASLSEWTEIQSKGGGVGINVSSLRPSGALVKGVNGTSSGPVNWAQLFAFVTSDIIIQGGSRRGAAMIMLDCDHPDIFEFIHAKETAGKLEGCNMSVCISDSFMVAVKQELDWDLKFEGKIYKTVKAKQIWDEICQAAWQSAEPGIYFMERANKEANSGYFETLIATNPCLARGSLVSSIDGLRPVQDIRVGDQIGTVQGLGLVDNVERHTLVPIFKVILSDGAELLATAAHRLHAIKKANRSKNNAIKKFDKVRIDELDLGDMVRIAPMAMPDNPVPDLISTLVDQEYGLLLGILLGDGCITQANLDRGRVNIAVNGGEVEWRTLVEELVIKATDGGKVSYYADKTYPNSANFRTQGESGLVSIVNSSALVPGYSHTKRVPEEYFRTNKLFLGGLLDGLFSSDGNVNLSSNHPDLRFKSTSHGLAIDVRRILLMFGIHGRITKSISSGGKINGRTIKSDKMQYTVHISGAGVRTFADKIGLSEPSKKKKLFEAVNTWALTGNTWLAQVQSIEPMGESEVFDIHEPESDTWIVDGVVSQGCGEQPLGPYGACLLGSFNLRAFITKDSHVAFDWEAFKKYIPYAVRFNDNIIDLSNYPLPECKESQERIRRMGLGVMGLADTLLDLKLRYGSKEAIEFTEAVFTALKEEAYKASALLAGERGSFPAFEADKYLKGQFIKRLPNSIKDLIAKNGIRNCYLLTQAPTGTTAQLVGVNSGIEPYFAFKTWRKDRLGEYWINTEWQEEYAKLNKASYLIIADEVSPEEHVRMQAAAQRHNDSSISKTANMPETATVDDVERLYMLAYDEGLKSLSVYRNNSRSVQVLNHTNEVESQPLAITHGRRPLPQDRQALTHKFTVDDQEGYLTIGMYDDGTPGEVFLRVNKQGATVSVLYDVIAMLLSYNFQYGVPLEVLVEKLSGIMFEPAGRTSNPKIPFATSIIDYMMRLIDTKWGDNSLLPINLEDKKGIITGESCPRCGSMMRRAEGCVGCPSCGYEKCG